MWLAGATLCRWAAKVDTRDYPSTPRGSLIAEHVLRTVTSQTAGHVTTLPAGRVGEWARLHARDQPVFIPSVDGVTKPWPVTGSPRLQ